MNVPPSGSHSISIDWSSEYHKQTQKLEPAAHGHRVEPNCMCTF